MVTGTIYLITNKINKKCYVGQTIKTPEYRWRQHIKCSKYEKVKHLPLYRAFRKYGVENFTFEVIVQNVPSDLLNDLETNCIEAYDGTKGYNILKIGNSTRGFKFSKETLLHLSNVRKGKEPINKGKKFPELSGKNSPRSKAVACLNDGLEYESAAAAASYYNLDNSSVIAVCKGKRLTTGSLKFSYIVDGVYTTNNRVSYRDGSANVNAKSVVCLTNSTEYGSISEAAKALGLKASSISMVCKQQRNSLFGYKFKYKE